jgi:hypothetical protein
MNGDLEAGGSVVNALHSFYFPEKIVYFFSRARCLPHNSPATKVLHECRYIISKVEECLSLY